MDIARFPHLTPGEFTSIITTFNDICQASTSKERHDWTSTSMRKDNESSASLMIVRSIVVSLYLTAIHDMFRPDDAKEDDQGLELIDEEVDEDVLQQDQSEICHLNVEYNIVYSPSYQVPVLYFSVTKQTGTTKKPITALEEIYEYLVPAAQKVHVKNNDILGAISSTVWL
jgi:ubiquitin-like-conjugating enzyme ATG10